MGPTDPADFLVSRTDLRRCRFAAAAIPELAPGQVLLRVDKFAFTANNVTYAVFGEAMAYWNFFPAEAGWGRVPVWGFADVIHSRHDGVAEGERIYGYLPMSTHLLVQPDRVTPAGFMDGAAHRRPLPAAYQLYRRVARDRAPADEDCQALLSPLFITSFLIDDFLADNAMFGARSVVLSSASSKTALGVAFLLGQNRRGEVIGLTSPANLGFCERLGYYDRVLSYEDLATLPASAPTVFVDMAGNGKLLHDVHHHFGDALKYSCMVGGTHWERRATQHALPGARPAFFFAPSQIKKRTADWGPGGVDQRFGATWQPFADSVGGWMKVIHGRGPKAVEAVYRRMLDGAAPPEEGHMLSP